MEPLYIYETKEMNSGAVMLFKKYFNRLIGTETQDTVVGLGTYSVACFELTLDEVYLCVRIEAFAHDPSPEVPAK